MSTYDSCVLKNENQCLNISEFVDSSTKEDAESKVRNLERRLNNMEATVSSMDKETRKDLAQMKEQINLLVNRMEVQTRVSMNYLPTL